LEKTRPLFHAYQEEGIGGKLMKSILVAVSLLAGLAQANVIFDYNSTASGSTVGAAVGATNVSGGLLNNTLVTGWIFGEVSVDPSWVGQPIVGQGFYFSNSTANPITAGITFGLWASDGPGGGPGTLIDIGASQTTALPVGTDYVSVDTGWATPAGNFWVGYAFENYATPTTTAADLNSLLFELGDAPTVGTSIGQALLGSQATFPLANDPSISGTADGRLATFLQVTSPEPSSGMLVTGGILLLAGAGFWRRRIVTC
jgi:hypothetical protein